MDTQDIESKLLELDFHIHGVTKIDYGQQIRLGCGAIINVFDTGTVLVQGKFLPGSRAESLSMLQQTLPPETRWCIK